MNASTHEGADGKRWWIGPVLTTGLLLFIIFLGIQSLVAAGAGIPLAAGGGQWIDTSDRQVVNDYYFNNFVSTQGVPMGWTGDRATCDAGTTAQAYRDAMRMQVNYFRAMAGVPANITFSPPYNNKAQQAALMMQVNNELNHDPPSDWECYTADGDEAAGKSNLGASGIGPYQVASYIDEGLLSVGHRRWVLYPQTQQMGTGDVAGSQAIWWANALWVQDDHIWDSRPATRDGYVAWPPPGYFPHPIVPTLWSLSLPTPAEFSTAVVTMTMNGAPLAIDTTYEVSCTEQFCAPEPSMIWVPDVDWEALDVSTDVVFHVDLSGVQVDGESQDFSYDVIIFAPQEESEPTLTPTATATATPTATATATRSPDEEFLLYLPLLQR